MSANGYKVETSTGKSGYKTLHSGLTERSAWFHFSRLSPVGGVNKRLVSPDGKVLARLRSAN